MQKTKRKGLFTISLALLFLFVAALAVTSLSSTVNALAECIEDADCTATVVGNIGQEEVFTVEETPFTLQEPTRPGYRFAGWYTNKDCANKVTDADCAEGKTLYAKWAEKTIFETYNAQSDRYEIYTLKQLEGISSLAYYNYNLGQTIIDSNIYLCANITLLGDWAVIQAQFYGTFEGNGYTITNLKITIKEGGFYGFFRRIEDGTVRNLKFAKVNITSSVDTKDSVTSVGAVAATSRGTVSECEVISGTISVTGYGAKVGGLVGTCDTGTMLKCLTGESLTVSGKGTLGGIIGSGTWDALIKECLNFSTVSYMFNKENGYVGGIAGKINYRTTIRSCENHGLIKYGGGIVLGSNVRPCMAQIVGWNESGYLEDNNCNGSCNYNALTTNQQKYCKTTEYGRYGNE